MNRHHAYDVLIFWEHNMGIFISKIKQRSKKNIQNKIQNKINDIYKKKETAVLNATSYNFDVTIMESGMHIQNFIKQKKKW